MFYKQYACPSVSHEALWSQCIPISPQGTKGGTGLDFSASVLTIENKCQSCNAGTWLVACRLVRIQVDVGGVSCTVDVSKVLTNHRRKRDNSGPASYGIKVRGISAQRSACDPCYTQRGSDGG